MTFMIIAYACTVLCAVAGVRAYLDTRTFRRHIALWQRRQQQADQDRAFAVWATWTMLSVTDRDGMVSASTLRQLYTAEVPDAVWDAPIAVALWHGDPDMVTRWETELKAEQEDTHG